MPKCPGHFGTGAEVSQDTSQDTSGRCSRLTARSLVAGPQAWNRLPAALRQLKTVLSWRRIVSVNKQLRFQCSYYGLLYVIVLYFILSYFIVTYFCPAPLSSFVRGDARRSTRQPDRQTTVCDERRCTTCFLCGLRGSTSTSPRYSVTFTGCGCQCG